MVRLKIISLYIYIYIYIYIDLKIKTVYYIVKSGQILGLLSHVTILSRMAT